MKNLQDFQEKLSQSKAFLQHKYKVTKIGIFGSYVRGEATNNSDLDILVEFEPNFKFGLLTFCNLENYLTELLGIKVDLVMKEGLKNKIGQQIITEVIYL